MGLSSMQKNPQLLDTLLALNTLVSSLGKSGLNKTVDEIKEGLADLKEQQDVLKADKRENDVSIIELEKAEEEYKRASLIAETTDKSLDKKNIALGEKDRLLKKETALLKTEKSALETAVKKHSGNVAVKERELSQKDAKLKLAQKEAEELKLEYEKKLADLKKITG